VDPYSPSNRTMHGMDRRRLLVVVAGAIAGALVVVAVAVAGRGGGQGNAAAQSTRPLHGMPPLLLRLPPALAPRVGESAAARLARLRGSGDVSTNGLLALAVGAAELDVGSAHGAAQAFDQAAATLGGHDSRVEVGRALLRYDATQPQPALAALDHIAAARPADELPRFERGVVLLYAGQDAAATTALRQVRARDPGGLYGGRADDLLHPGMLPGSPFWIAARPAAAGTPLADAAKLEGEGQREAALAAAKRAVARDPASVDAAVAVAVLGFDKDQPSQAFGALGNLTRSFPSAASPVFHLGVLLLWIGQPARAKTEFQKAVALDPRGRIGQVARRLAALHSGRG
jgi:tetratricopeptide (TPR) repeat protein